MDKIIVQDFVKEFKDKKIMNTKTNPTAVEDFINSKVEFRTYIPFTMKREIAQTVVQENIRIVDGIKKVDSIAQYISFVISMLVAHTSLDIENPFDDYDALCESGLMGVIISHFQTDYDECDAMVKMRLADEMQDNTTTAVVAKFLNEIIENLGDFKEVLKEKLADFDLDGLLNVIGIDDENKGPISGIFNK